jgi:PAS domain S-box-containing protein
MGSLKSKAEGDPVNLLSVRGVSLEYGAVRALREVNVSIREGEVLAVVGEHGAGKSSLGRVISGMNQPSVGELFWKGTRLDSFASSAARGIGIEMVPQQSKLFDGISVAENLFIGGRGKFYRSFFSLNRMARDARRYLESVDCRIDPRTLVQNLTLSDRVFLEIVRHLRFRPKLLILDESLEKLTQSGLNVILPLLLELKDRGMAILFITHRIDDVYSFADRVAIMRSGEIFFEDAVKSIDKISLIRLAYTQIMRQEGSHDLAKEFHELLVYNEAIIDSLPVNLIVADSMGAIRIVNNSAVDYFGRAETSLRQISVEEFFLSMISPDDGRGFVDMMRETLCGSGMRSLYNIRMTVNGESRTANVMTSPIFDSSRCVGCMVIVDDITEQEKLRQQVILSEKLASLGILAAGVAHEINNPLGVAFNYLDLMAFKLGNDELKDLVRKVEDEVSCIQQIVSNLITFSDKKPQTLQRFDLNSLIADIVDLVVFHAAHEGIVVELCPCEQALPIFANRTEIKQVVLNIIRNGFEAMTSGGRLCISTRCDEADGGSSAVMVFEDDGLGIPSQKLSDIFLPFYSTKSGTGGNMGLGLSISYGIVRKHGGSIEVENLPNQGCRFSVRLPVCASGAGADHGSV